MKQIFVSYRRSDSSDVTGRIFDRLKSKFGADCLFKDVDSIPLGKDFRTAIAGAIDQSKVALVVIGDEWLTAKDESGQRRIDDPDDTVGIEIGTALNRDIPVVPILVAGAAMPKSEELPAALEDLAFRNAIPVRPDPDFHNDMDRLCRELETHVKPNRRNWAKLAAWTVGGAALLALAVFVASNLRGPDPNESSTPSGETGHSTDAAGTQPVVPSQIDRANAKETAEAILQAYKARDVINLAAFVDGQNRAFFAELASQGESHPRYSSIFTGWRWDGVRQWSGDTGEVRYRHYVGTTRNQYEAQVEFGQISSDEILVVTLTWVDGKWVFEDIHSPTPKMFSEGALEFRLVPEPY